MTISLAYLKFLEKVNANFTNDTVSADKSRFILLFNEVQIRYLEWLLEKRNEDSIRYAQEMVERYQNTVQTNTIQYATTPLPEDYFDLVTARSFVRTDECADYIELFEVKQEHTDLYYRDAFNSPSFKYRESFFTISNNKIRVYKKDFEVEKVELHYYRYPKDVDISGYLKIDQTHSTDIDPEWDDKSVYRILNGCAFQFNINNNNLGKVQFDKDRIFSKI